MQIVTCPIRCPARRPPVPRPVPSRGGLRHKCRQPASVGDAFNYLLRTLMVEAGKMCLVEQVSGEVRLSLATFPAEF